MTAASIRTELAAAIRKVNAEFARLPRQVQDSIVISYDDLDKEIDAAILADDRARALAALRAWVQHWLATLEEAAQ
jgi:hypothetical protein